MPSKTKKTSRKKVTKKTNRKKARPATKKASRKRAIRKTTPKRRAKKAAAKKAGRKTAKKTATKRTARRKTKPVLVCAYGQDCFWVNQGPVLQDLIQLRDALTEMSDATFKHHVSRNHNDFADWVQLVLSDKHCANALRKSTKPQTAKSVLIKRLKYYHS